MLFPDYTQPFVKTYKVTRKTTSQQLRWKLSKTFHLTCRHPALGICVSQ